METKDYRQCVLVNTTFFDKHPDSPAWDGVPLNNTAHTPGPWQWSETGYALHPEFPQPDMHHVHTILEIDTFGYGFIGSSVEDTLKETQANIAIIAAAPQLLEALIIAEEFMRGFEGDEAQVGMEIKLAIMRLALARARGGI